MQTIFAVDDSRSTKTSTNYWNKVLTLFEAFVKDATIPHYNVLWSNKTFLVDDEMLIKTIANKGYHHGKTKISSLAQFLINGYRLDEIKLILITDGQVTPREVKLADTILHHSFFREVQVYFITTDGPINLSVSAPFTRKTSFYLEVDDKVIAQGRSDLKIDFSNYYDLNVFLREFNNLKIAFVAQNMGYHNEEARKEIHHLYDVLIKKIEEDLDFTSIQEALLVKSSSQALTMIRKAIGQQDKIKKVKENVNTLLKVSNNDYGYSVEAYTSWDDEENNLKRERISSPEQFILDDKSCPVLTVYRTNLNLTHEIRNHLSTNPLFIMSYPYLLSELVSSISCQPNETRSILGVLALGQEEKHHQISDWTLRQLHLPGDLNLWMLVFYYLILTYLPHLFSENRDLLLSFEDHLRFRLINRKINFFNFPDINAPIGVVLWYRYVGDFISYANDPKLILEDDYLVAMAGLKILDYPLLYKS